MENLSLKQYSDYRAFLLSHIQDCKQTKPGWTFGRFAQQLGVKDVSSITKIIQGQRNPGPDLTEKLIQYFKFSKRDAQYFHDLIRLRKIQGDPRLTVLLLEKMGKDHPSASMRLLDDQAFQIISQWYCTAIREMVKLDQFVSDPTWISKNLNFKVTPTEAERAIELLIEAKLLERGARGQLKVTEGRFHAGNELSSEAIKRYHESMLDHAKTAIRTVSVKDREFTASVITMKTARVPEAKELIREFKSKFAKLLEEQPGDVTTQLQIQFFPLTKISSEKKQPTSTQLEN